MGTLLVFIPPHASRGTDQMCFGALIKKQNQEGFVDRRLLLSQGEVVPDVENDDHKNEEAG